MTNKQLPKVKLPEDFSVLGPCDKVIMLTVTLDKILFVAKKDLEARRGP